MSTTDPQTDAKRAGFPGHVEDSVDMLISSLLGAVGHSLTEAEVMIVTQTDHSSGAGGGGGLSPNHLFLTIL